MRRHTLTAGEHVLVVGFGPVAVRLVDGLLPEVARGRLRVTVVGAEERPGYNRVLLGEYAVGRYSAAGLDIVDSAGWQAAGVEVRIGCRVQWLDRSARVAQLADGSRIGYDVVVLAVGARANIPRLRGINPDPAAAHLPAGVTALRTVSDADQVRAVVSEQGRVIVLGGGVLGLEVALAAHEEGCAVTVVHHRPWLLTRSTDRSGGAMLNRALAERGVTVLADVVCRGVRLDQDRRVTGLVLDDHRVVGSDLLILGCGTTPRTQIATGAGLTVDRGIVVNHDLEADPESRVFAIGDCAEVLCNNPTCTVCPSRRGRGPAGLVGPGWQQASWLARRFAHELAESVEPLEPFPSIEPDVIRLKSRTVDFAAAGEIDGDPWEDQPPGRTVAQWADRWRYAKLVLREDRLVGFVALGLPRLAAELAVAYGSGQELPEDLTVLFRLDGPEREPSTELGETATVCRCAGVPVGAIRTAITQGHATVEDVRRVTRAGSGCGGCHGLVRRLLGES
jgi:assimilatory nitrate reductase electron transfer subunit